MTHAARPSTNHSSGHRQLLQRASKRRQPVNVPQPAALQRQPLDRRRQQRGERVVVAADAAVECVDALKAFAFGQRRHINLAQRRAEAHAQRRQRKSA
eukprot:237852-Chlamydomonas_euryale.AAC.2